jgi:hypothetical protein
MFEVSSNTMTLAALGALVLIAVQLLSVLCIFFSLRCAARERSKLAKEMFGLMKRIEGLTSGRRERLSAHFDKMQDTLALRLPTSVSAKASELILETEAKVLARLAELEPNLKSSPAARKKMESLVCSMENLEETMVAITADTVHQVLIESRRDLLGDEGRDLSGEFAE